MKPVEKATANLLSYQSTERDRSMRPRPQNLQRNMALNAENIRHLLEELDSGSSDDESVLGY